MAGYDRNTVVIFVLFILVLGFLLLLLLFRVWYIMIIFRVQIIITFVLTMLNNSSRLYGEYPFIILQLETV